MSNSSGGGKDRRGAPRPQARAGTSRWLPAVFLGVFVVAGLALTVLPPRPAEDPASQAQAQAPATAAAPLEAAPTAEPAESGTRAVTAEDGVVRLPLSDLQGSAARFYTFQSEGKVIPFFVLKSSDGVVRAAFDACDVCFQARLGYHQEGDEMVCNNCGTRFPSTQINEVQGGCNPGPIERQVEGDAIILQASDLAAGAKYF